MRDRRLAAVAALAGALGPAPLPLLEAFAGGPHPGSGPELTLAQILGALVGRHPTLLAADARVRAADGQERPAHGAFDVQVQAQGWAAPVGYDRYGRSNFVLSQATPLQGRP